MILSQLGHDRHRDEKLPFGDKQRQAGGPANGLSPPIVAFWFSHLATVLARPNDRLYRILNDGLGLSQLSYCQTKSENQHRFTNYQLKQFVSDK